MLRKIIYLLIMVLMMANIISAEGAAPPKKVKLIQLKQLRWYVHTDSAVGADVLRIVIDSDEPVTATSRLEGLMSKKLIVTIKETNAAKLPKSMRLDGRLANALNITTVNNSTVIAIDVPRILEEADYKVFTLPKDEAAKKTFRVVIDINKPAPPLKTTGITPGLGKKLIAVDAGHGGSDPGAIGSGGTYEKTVNLAVALKVKAILEKAGAKVLMTRIDDRDVYGPKATNKQELNARIEKSNAQKADIYISIHSNSSLNPQISGVSTYYTPKTPYDQLLAKTIQAALVATLGIDNRGYLTAEFYVTKNSNMPAVLVEMAFLSNSAEEKLLNDPAFQQKVAAAIVKGAEAFFAQAAKLGGDQ